VEQLRKSKSLGAIDKILFPSQLKQSIASSTALTPFLTVAEVVQESVSPKNPSTPVCSASALKRDTVRFLPGLQLVNVGSSYFKGICAGFKANEKKREGIMSSCGQPQTTEFVLHLEFGEKERVHEFDVNIQQQVSAQNRAEQT
jgi:hypothetical protein